MINRRSLYLFLLIGLFTPAFSQNWQAKIQAWIYPASDTCVTGKQEYQDGRGLYAIKPEYFSIATNGAWRWLNESAGDPESCNGYSAANVASIKAKSVIQYVTVSAGAGVAPFVASSTQTSSAISTWVNFCVQSGFIGVELDFEGYGDWTATTYTQFKTFVTNLGNALHAQNKELMINGPPIYDATSQGWYEWKYEDFVNLPIDYMSVMAYDYMYDWGGGTPVQPLQWLDNIITWTLNKYPYINKIVMGIPSYGYYATVDQWNIARVNKQQALARAGSNSAARDASSGEMKWVRNNVATFYQDTTGLNQKRAAIEARGIKHVSVFHLGGNDWFTGTEPDGGYPASGATSATSAPTSAPTSTPSSGQTPVSTDQTPSSGQTPATSQTPGSTKQPAVTEKPDDNNIYEGTCVNLCESQQDQLVQRVQQSSDDSPIVPALVVGAVIGILMLVVGVVLGFKLGQKNPNFRIFAKKEDDSAGVQMVTIVPGSPGPASRSASDNFPDSPSLPPRGISHRNVFQQGMVDSPDLSQIRRSQTRQ